MSEKSLQELYAPSSTCFGCGPSNEKGLRIRSFPQGDIVVASWTPENYHEAFPGVLNGGIIGSLLDCHCNWTAAWHIMNGLSLDQPLCTVTAEYSIKLMRPTPSQSEVALESRIVEYDGKHKVTVEGTLKVGDKICATCSGVFVAVKEGHPAYHRWG
ncbi:MAG: PaaI family thioesterase [Bdellovibrionota bacterium]|nr:PaaI family thioesterase [Bdellovibrionota bacterium]